MPSLRARLVYAWLRRVVKAQSLADPSVEGARRRLVKATRLARPPRYVQLRDVSIRPASGPTVRAEWVDQPDIDPDTVVLYLHGGAYVIGSPATHRELTWRFGRAAGARVLAVDYRLAPEHPYPAAVDDALAAYLWLVEQGHDPRRIVVGGDSAGGGLAMALLLRLRATGRPLPAMTVLLSPWVDLTCSADAYARLEQAEAYLTHETLDAWAGLYAGADRRQPEVSPLFADLSGLCPVLIHVGGDEILVDDASGLADALRAAAVPVDLEVWPGHAHVFPGIARLIPEGRAAWTMIGDAVRRRLTTDPAP